MKILHVVNSDIRGGAPRAAFSLNKNLRNLGIDSQMLVQRKFSTDNSVNSLSDNLISRYCTNVRMLADLMQMSLLTKKEKGRFSFASVGKNIIDHQSVNNADLLHLHWINEGFLSINNIIKLKMLGKPIVWTLHDMWTITGGCHYSGGCRRFEITCRNCPFLRYPSDRDSSTIQQDNKIKLFKKLNPVIVTCSSWLKEEALKSNIMNSLAIHVIPNAINTEIYKPEEKSTARKKFDLPEDKILILFTALNTNEERKGFTKLKSAILKLCEKYPVIRNNAELVVLGTSSMEELSGLPIKVNLLGRIYDDSSISDCYNSADVFVAPSLEDNLPNTVMEALACGIPVVAFNTGGIPDMVEHNLNGYLAQPYSIEDLADGIFYVVHDRVNVTQLSQYARTKVLKNFTPEIVGSKYLSLYESLLQR